MANSIVFRSALTLTVIFGYVQVTGAIQCYACSYLFSGNTGIFDYECVNDTANFSKKSVIQCAASKKCTIKTVYERGYSRLRSIVKDCHDYGTEAGCDEPDVVRPTCYYQCTTDLCNGIDGDLKPPKPTGKTSALKSTSSLILGLILLLFLNSIDM